MGEASSEAFTAHLSILSPPRVWKKEAVRVQRLHDCGLLRESPCLICASKFQVLNIHRNHRHTQSEACQRRHWPLHRDICLLARRVKKNNSSKRHLHDAVDGWILRHASSLSHAAAIALDVGTDFANTKKYVLSVLLHSRPSDLAEHRFYVVAAEVLPIEVFSPRLTVQQLDDAIRSAECVTATFIAIAVIDYELLSFLPMCCGQKTYSEFVQMAKSNYDNEPEAREWTKWLTELINDGRVIQRD